MSALNLIWLVPAVFVGTIAVMSGCWRFFSWLGRTHEDGMDRWSERLFPGINGRRDRR